MFPAHSAAASSVAVLLLTIAAPAGAAGSTTRVSVSTAGTQANGVSFGSALSADGRYVAFSSDATNLVPGDTNNAGDVFVRDRRTGTTERVSLSSAGAQGGEESFGTSITPDGRYVAFASRAPNLVPGDTNGQTDAFIRDRRTGTTTRISVSARGTQGNSESTFPRLSADGRHVAFPSWATNLIPGDTTAGVFVRGLDSGTLERVSATGTGATISGDGRYVAFDTYASNEVPGDTNTSGDVFVRDRQTRTTTRISVASNGAQADNDSGTAAMTPDGRYVAFDSLASNLVPGDAPGPRAVFVRDRQTGATSRIAVGTNPALSADGRYIAFQDRPVDGEHTQVFVRDRQTGTTTRISVATDGTPANGLSYQAALSADGRQVAFHSAATNLIPADTNNTGDIFTRPTQ